MMVNAEGRKGLLSGNALKILAAVAMTADHVGLMFFPGVEAFRILGRLAFPIFAYMIAEGCHYTRNRLRYFLHIFILATVCQIVYFLVDGSLYMSILVTFSLSLLMIYPMQELKAALCFPGWRKIAWSAVTVSAVAIVYWLNTCFEIDYGFWGCMVPVFAALPGVRGNVGPRWISRLDRKEIRVLSFGTGLLLLSLDLGGNQIWSLAALPLLQLYSGKRGKYKMKYFFYIFYPLHLAVIQGIAWLL